MKTTLLLSDAVETQRLFAQTLTGRTSVMPVTLPTEPSRTKFDALFATWLRLVDAVILDGVALGQMLRWAVESLSATELPVVVRLTDAQRQQYPLPEHWLAVADTTPPVQLQQSLATFFDLHEARSRLSHAPRPQTTEPTRMTPVSLDSYRYRDALKNLSRLLGQRHGEYELLTEFLRLVRELLGVGKLAIFACRDDGGLFAGETTGELTIVANDGIAPTIAEHLRLDLDAGIGGCLAREVRIVRRGQSDAHGEREFELLGTEVAVPMFDSDRLLGVLTFSGKVTGEPITNEELELVFQLASQLSQAMRNLQLVERVASQQRLMSEVLANVHSGVLVVDQDEHVLAANDRLRALLELGTEPLVGRELSRLPGRVSDVVFEVLGSEVANIDREVTLPRSQRPVRVLATRFAQADTGKAVVVALVEDLTQEKLEQAHRREADDREFFTRLAFRLSHELKNSMVSIKIFAQLLPERYSEKDFREQFSSVVSNEINRVDVLVNNLTFFSHPLALVYEEVVLTDLLESCARNVGGEFARRQLAQLISVGDKTEPVAGVPVVTFKKNFAHKLARLEADKLRLMQGIEHVLRNALQAMPAGGRLSISTSDCAEGEAPAGGAVKIEFQDVGEGIGLETLPRVTEPFVTTRNVGVGLGLTIVKKIVERHSGRLEIDSMLGRGTTVTMVLPVKAQAHPEDALLQELTKSVSGVEDHGEPTAPGRLPKALGNERS
jgi:signal transduction histidine kinase